MFQREHTIFIIKSYYSNGNRGENGDWIYSPRLCLNEFREISTTLKYSCGQIKATTKLTFYVIFINFGNSGF
jgi:hypothetical protein